MEGKEQKSIAIIATPDQNQMKQIMGICNNCHIASVGVSDIQELLDRVQEQVFTMLIISDKITDEHLFNQIIIIRNKSCDKYLPVILICSDHQESFEDQIKPMLSAPFDMISDPVNPNILTCKIHLLLTLDYQKKTIQREMHKTSRALSAKKTFLASISYNIRTPINSIIGLTDLLIGDKLDSEQTKYILSIRRSGELLLALFRSKIDYANIQAGSLELESKVFEPINIIQKVGAMLSSILHSKRTELITNLDPSLPRVLRGDPVHFEQILFNLLFVCIQQTINNSITLHIRVHSKQEDQIKLYISIEDERLDLNDTQLSALVDDSVSDINNIHIGLFVTRHVVQSMGGNIGFSINDDNHTELWCTACFLKTSLNTEKEWQDLDINELETIPCASLSPEDLRILLVEDSPINQLVEKKLLNKLGFTQIEIVENGEEAVNILTKKDFDLVLMDIFMPVMNGLDASRIIRYQDEVRNPNIPIIALTAQDTDQLKADFFNHGINLFISKPLKINSIARAIQECFPRLKLLSFGQEEINHENQEPPAEMPKKLETKKVHVFDKKGLLERLDGDEALYQELVGGFMADIPIQINKIEKALDFDDLSIAENIAHTLKGAFSNVGAQLLQNIAKELEDDIQSGDMKRIQQRILQLKQSFNNVKKYI